MLLCSFLFLLLCFLFFVASELQHLTGCTKWHYGEMLTKVKEPQTAPWSFQTGVKMSTFARFILKKVRTVFTNAVVNEQCDCRIINRFWWPLLERERERREGVMEGDIFIIHCSLTHADASQRRSVIPSLPLFKQQFLFWQAHRINAREKLCKEGIFYLGFSPVYGDLCSPNKGVLESLELRYNYNR